MQIKYIFHSAFAFLVLVILVMSSKKMIDDDVVLIDLEVNDDKNSSHTNSGTTQNRNMLKYEPTPSTSDHKTIKPTPETINGVNNTNRDKEASFVSLLKNNALMNKIVKHCMNIEKNAGMKRVIQRTLLPIYKDANLQFKESELLTEMLKTTLHKLKYDENYKFLHIKTLCEEIKSNKYRKKVPFVTIATNIKKNPRKQRAIQLKEKFLHLSNGRHIKNKYNKTDVTELDKSDGEAVITVDIGDDSESDKDDIMIVEDVHNDVNDETNEQSDKENNKTEANDKIETDKIWIDVDCNFEIDNNKHETVVDTIETDTNNDNKKGTIGKENGRITINEIDSMETDNVIETVSNTNNEDQTETNITETANKSIETADDKNAKDMHSNYELLLPHNSVSYTNYSEEQITIASIEKEIEECKERIAQLEQQEVTNNSCLSPYLLCDKYKAKIVSLYKKLCKISGYGDGNLKKQRFIHLHIVEGHTPGPVKRFEQFLNSTMDDTGTIPLPDFDDVIGCVTQSNIADNLGWNKQDIMNEALALFTHCGHALRKERQKREYRDLLSLAQNEDIEKYDPANEDPVLLRRLEENKLIAKANENEVLERFVQMENLPKTSTRHNPRLYDVNMSESSDTDTESDSESGLSQQLNTPTSNYEPTLISNINERESSENIKSMHDISTQCIVNQHVNSNIIVSTSMNVEKATVHCTKNNSTILDTPKIYTDLNKLHKIGASNRFVIAYQSDANDVHEHDSNVVSTAAVKEEIILDTNNVMSGKNAVTPETNSVMPAIIDTSEMSETDAVTSEIDAVMSETNTVISETKEVTLGADSSMSEKKDETMLITEIKKEPLDIQSLLNNLGDSYITTIINIQDPFVVIEISDSSDDDL